MLPASPPVRHPVARMHDIKAKTQAAARRVTPPPLRMDTVASLPPVVSPILSAVASVPPQAIMSEPCQTTGASTGSDYIRGTRGNWNAVAAMAKSQDGLRRAFEQAVVTIYQRGRDMAMVNALESQPFEPELVPSRCCYKTAPTPS